MSGRHGRFIASHPVHARTEELAAFRSQPRRSRAAERRGVARTPGSGVRSFSDARRRGRAARPLFAIAAAPSCGSAACGRTRPTSRERCRTSTAPWPSSAYAESHSDRPSAWHARILRPQGRARVLAGEHGRLRPRAAGAGAAEGRALEFAEKILTRKPPCRGLYEWIGAPTGLNFRPSVQTMCSRRRDRCSRRHPARGPGRPSRARPPQAQSASGRPSSAIW